MIMKKVFLYTLAGALMFGACKKDEEETPATTTPAPVADTEAPVAAITSPAAGVKVEQGKSVEVAMTFTDNEALSVYAFVSTVAGNDAGATISGKSASASATIKTTATTKLGEYTMTVTCTDAAGNVSKPVIVSFSVVEPPDTEAPKVVSVKKIAPSGPYETGSSSTNKVEIEVTDNKELGEIKIELFNTDPGYNRVVYTKTIAAADNAGKMSYKEEIQFTVKVQDASGIGSGDAAKWIITATDKAGNVTKDESHTAKIL